MNRIVPKVLYPAEFAQQVHKILCHWILPVEFVAAMTPAVRRSKANETQIHTTNCDHPGEQTSILWGFADFFKCWESMVAPYKRRLRKYIDKKACQILGLEPTTRDEPATEYRTDGGFGMFI
jgi:hypothetical protein